MIISFYLDAIEAGECQVHNKPDYLSLASNKNEDNSGQITVSDFANNLQALLGLSSDQVDKILSKKFCILIRIKSLDQQANFLFYSSFENSFTDLVIPRRRS